MKSYAYEIEMAHIQNGSKSRSRVFFAEMAQFFRLKNRDGSKFEPIYSLNSISLLILSHLGFFPTEKMSHLDDKPRDR